METVIQTNQRLCVEEILCSLFYISRGISRCFVF